MNVIFKLFDKFSIGKEGSRGTKKICFEASTCLNRLLGCLNLGERELTRGKVASWDLVRVQFFLYKSWLLDLKRDVCLLGKTMYAHILKLCPDYATLPPINFGAPRRSSSVQGR